MNEIPVYNELPVIFTKDKLFMNRFRERKVQPADIVVLPEDAILIFLPQIVSVEMPKPILP